jgi:ATP adenylyltransferase
VTGFDQRRCDDGECPFCVPDAYCGLGANAHAYAVLDRFPVVPLHALVLPRRHVADYLALSEEEAAACHALLREVARAIQARDASIEAFNIGINAGVAAGQTILHAHIHLIPRRMGDVSDPRGGVRHVIPGKGFYSS